MRLFPVPPVIGDETGFDQADLFQRQEFGDRLTRLIRALEHPAVLLLDAPWGAGKTTFVKMWEGSLRQQKIPVIHFDAFASDYMADPFTALAGEVLDLAKQHQTDEAKVDEFRKKAFGVAKTLARHGLRIGVKVATQGFVDIGDSTDSKAGEKAIVDGVSDAADALLLKRLENHAEDRASFTAFRRALAELTTTLVPADLPEGKRRPRLVFIIDELDRCRPTFALSLLETVKHFFDVEGVVFLLVTNLQQLEKSVEFAYGAGIDARGYLDKFFHLRALLPAMQNKHPLTRTYSHHLLKNVPEWFYGIQLDALVGLATSIAQKHEFSLRKIERAFAYLNIFVASRQNNQAFMPEIAIALCFMKAGAPDSYNTVRLTGQTIELLEDWGLHKTAKLQNPILISYFIGRVISDDVAAEIQMNELRGTGLRRDEYIPLWCSWIDGFALPDDMA